MVGGNLAFPPLVEFKTEAEYQNHFYQVYCKNPITTFDNIKVRFRKRQFKHCCYESTKRNKRKDLFLVKRAEKIDWIKATLQDSDASLYDGWDSKKKVYDGSRRVAVVKGNYVVIIVFTNEKTADFVTSFVADTPETLRRIKLSPKWA